MKTIFFLIFFCSVLFTQDVKAQELSMVKWYHIERAQELTSDTAKPIFIDFTAVWCGWCKKMDKTTFQEEKVIRKLNESYYAVKIDFDSKVAFEFKGKQYVAKELAEEFGVQGLPTMILLSPDLNKHELIVGYRKSKPFLSKLENTFN